MTTNTTVGHQLPADPPPVIVGSEGVPAPAPGEVSWGAGSSTGSVRAGR